MYLKASYCSLILSQSKYVTGAAVHIPGLMQIMHAIVYDRNRQIQSFIPGR